MSMKKSKYNLERTSPHSELYTVPGTTTVLSFNYDIDANGSTAKVEISTDSGNSFTPYTSFAIDCGTDWNEEEAVWNDTMINSLYMGIGTHYCRVFKEG